MQLRITPRVIIKKLYDCPFIAYLLYATPYILYIVLDLLSSLIDAFNIFYSLLFVGYLGTACYTRPLNVFNLIVFK